MSPVYLITTPDVVGVLCKVTAESEDETVKRISEQYSELRKTPDTSTLRSFTKSISYRGLPDEMLSIQQMSIQFASENSHRCVVFDEVDEQNT